MMNISETLTMTLLAFTQTVVPETTTMKIRKATIATATTLSLMSPEEAQLIEGKTTLITEDPKMILILDARWISGIHSVMHTDATCACI
ncbi:hypothetical protein PDJAM_G00094100 [Pangasius djambal]|uniref:Uncharacterized protein n=1 Tax=Pangasius djambal TaxID=1691987 RepID=A0ACC5Z6G4_9TELE|nr:hypothetical protein [Pangasius djambal]